MSEVVVVGAGVIGLSVSWFLAREGVAVTVCGAGPLGQAASSRAHGQVVPPRRALQPMWRASIDAYDELAAQGEFEWDREPIGTVVLANDPGEVALLRKREVDGHGQIVGPELLRALEPALSSRIAAALVFAEGRRLSPPAVVSTLVRTTARLGVGLRQDRTVVGLDRRAGQWWLSCSGGEVVRSPTVVLAAGLATRKLAQSVGVSLGLVGKRGRILLSEPRQPVLRHLISEAGVAAASSSPESAGSQVALLAHQRQDGRVVLGASWTAETAVEPADLDHQILRHAIARVPRLWDLRVSARWTGTRPGSTDGLPIIGEIDDGLFVCCGHGGEGFIAGPGSARLLAERLTGHVPLTDPAPFLPDRQTAVGREGVSR